MSIEKVAKNIALGVAVAGLSAYAAGIPIAIRALSAGARKGVDSAYSDIVESKKLDEIKKGMENKDPNVAKQIDAIA